MAAENLQSAQDARTTQSAAKGQAAAKKPAQAAKPPRKKLTLTTKVLIGLVLGGIVGAILHSVAADTAWVSDILVGGVFHVVGQGFLRLLKMLVVPLVFFSLITGAAAIGDIKTLGTVGLKTLLFYLTTTALAVTLAITVGHVINPGLGVDTSSIEVGEVKLPEKTSVSDTLLDIIPDNPFGALAGGNMLAVIFFALFIGIILAVMGSKVNTVRSFAEQANDIMMMMTQIIMKLAPYGVFALLAKTFYSLGLAAMIPLAKYMIGVLLALAAHSLVVYMILFALFTRLNPLRFMRKFASVWLYAFSTASSNATIPVNIETLEDKIGVDRKVSSFTIPLGATINMDGTAIMQGVAVVFTAQLFGIDLGISGYLTVIATATIASIGTAGVPSVGLVTLSMVFNSVGLPLEGIGMIMGIDRILDMVRTAVNVTGDAVVTCIVAKQEGLLDVERFRDAGAEADGEPALR